MITGGQRSPREIFNIRTMARVKQTDDTGGLDNRTTGIHGQSVTAKCFTS